MFYWKKDPRRVKRTGERLEKISHEKKIQISKHQSERKQAPSLGGDALDREAKQRSGTKTDFRE